MNTENYCVFSEAKMMKENKGSTVALRYKYSTGTGTRSTHQCSYGTRTVLYISPVYCLPNVVLHRCDIMVIFAPLNIQTLI